MLGVALGEPAQPLPLIPKPVELQPKDGSFRLGPETGIRFDRSLKKEAELLAADLAKVTGTSPKLVAEEQKMALPSQIEVDVDPASTLPAEGYSLEISTKGVRIVGKDAAGAWNGTRTIVQMLPTEKPAGGTVNLAALAIRDYPRFGWRGMHLDVGRHIFAVEDIKKFIDWLAFHKINTLHWHLTEDQGWRIEIKKYPKLTEVGAWRTSTPPYGNRNSDDGKRYGGFYTQEQVKEIVAYATARHITVVPEIDMPGHMAAAIAAYPELGNNDIPGFAPKVATRWGVFYDILAPTEKTFQFVDDVLTEVCALFPSAYIHIGGDEAPKNQWDRSPRVKELMQREGLKDGHDVQSYFIKRVEKILEAKGRKLIGWDEIREGGLSPKATVMSWRGEQGGIASAKEGHDVVMAANSHLYFDHYQMPAEQELAKGKEYEMIGGFLPLEKVYSYNPVPAVLNEQEAKHILGAQGQLWSEYFHDYKKVEYAAFPRMAALAEVVWTPVKQKDYKDFQQRLGGVIARYKAAGVNVGPFYQTPIRKTKDGSTVSSSLEAYQENWAELAYDGRAETFFWASRAPKENDHLTVQLRNPLTKPAKVEITTGDVQGKGGDVLESGVLEATIDGGNTWVKVADFAAAKASGTAPAGTAQLRIRVTQAQKNWLKVQEIKMD